MFKCLDGSLGSLESVFSRDVVQFGFGLEIMNCSHSIGKGPMVVMRA